MSERSTRIGNIGSADRASVDSGGQVTTFGERWSLDWWVLADDGWHIASDERGSKMSQRLVEATPVVETAMRVPGGRVSHRAYAIAGTDEFAVIELTNHSPVPVAVAFAVRGDDGELHDQTVTVDGRVALALPKPPAQRENEAFVYPLPHTATIRVLAPLRAAQELPSLPDTLSTSEQVVNGWLVHARQGMRIVVPDPRLQEAIDATRMALALGDDDDPTIAAALGRFGSTDKSVRVRASAVARTATRIVRDRRKRAHDRDLHDWAGLRAAAELLQVLSEEDAALQATSEVDRVWVDDLGNPLETLQSLLDAASATWTWADDWAPVALLFLVRDLLVREVRREGGVGLDVLTLVPDAWLGQGVEVHDAPTHHGTLSYAVRWHGDRPALLWELQPSTDGIVTLRAPGLDAAWSTTEPVGEALLARVALKVTAP